MTFKRLWLCYSTGRLPQIAYVTIQVENGGKLWRNLVDLESRDAIGSLATSALAAFLIFKQAHGTTYPLFLSSALYSR